MGVSEDASVTVAFELAALERLAVPAAVFRQTLGWAEHLGVISDRPTHVVTEFARTHALDIGFHSGPRSLMEALPNIRVQPELAAERYLLIGTDSVDPSEVRLAGWAFLGIDDAAKAAGWRIAGTSDERTDRDTSWL